MHFIHCWLYREKQNLGNADTSIAFKLEDVLSIESLLIAREQDTTVEVCRIALKGRQEPVLVWLTLSMLQQIIAPFTSFSDVES